MFVTGPCVPGACGVGDYTARLANILREQGLEVEIMNEGRWGLGDVGSARKAIARWEPEIVHMQYPSSAFGHRLGPQAFVMGNNVVTTLHEGSQSHILRKLSLYPFLLKSRHVIFTSDFERQFGLRLAPWIAGNSSVIPIGSNISTGPPELERHGEILYFGLIMPKKGIEDFIALAEIAQELEPSRRFRIVGRAGAGHEEYLRRLQAETAKLPITWRIDRSDEDVAIELSSAALAYLPFPDGASERRASLKALLANGVAVVTTRGPQTPSDLASVLRFAQEPTEARQVLQQLTEDSAELNRLSAAGPAYMKQFSWDAIAQLHIDLYQRLAPEKPS